MAHSDRLAAFEPLRDGPWLGALVGLTVALLLALRSLDAALVTPAAPLGIVSFELAGDMQTAQRILDSWTAAGRVDAAIGLGLDYLFLVSYSLTIALGCLKTGGALARRGSRLAAPHVALARAQGIAAALDAVENLALIQLLRGSTWEPWPALARACAIPKFAIVAAGLLYVAAASLALLRAFRRREAGTG